jgi:hypothetical protein
MRPRLAENLIDVASRPDADLVFVLRILDLDETRAV